MKTRSLATTGTDRSETWNTGGGARATFVPGLKAPASKGIPFPCGEPLWPRSTSYRHWERHRDERPALAFHYESLDV